MKLAYKMTLSRSNQVNGVDFDAFSDLIFKYFDWKSELEKQTLKTVFDSAIEEKNEKSLVRRDPERPKNLLCRKEFIEALIQSVQIEFK